MARCRNVLAFLLAKAYGKPLVLMPAVVMARFQHPFLVCNAARPITPDGLAGKRVGVRSPSVTTASSSQNWIP
jgi:4,5-dihydroxyphthalate decarboxylase